MTPSSAGSPAAGWYPDPSGQPGNGQPSQLRYWDGQRWTEHVHAQPAAQQSGQQPAAYGQAYGQQPYGQQTYGQQAAYATATYGGSSQATTTPDGRPLAGWGERLGASLIDGIIFLVVVAVPIVPIYISMFHTLIQNANRLQQQQLSSGGRVAFDPFSLYQGLWGQLALIYLIGLALGLVYNVGFLVWKQATPGKLMLGLRVEPRSAPGPITVGVALKRWAVAYLPALVASGLWSLLDGLWPLWDKDRQALHEKWAGTNVVRRR